MFQSRGSHPGTSSDPTSYFSCGGTLRREVQGWPLPFSIPFGLLTNPSPPFRKSSKLLSPTRVSLLLDSRIVIQDCTRGLFSAGGQICFHDIHNETNCLGWRKRSRSMAIESGFPFPLFEANRQPKGPERTGAMSAPAESRGRVSKTIPFRSGVPGENGSRSMKCSLNSMI